MLSPATRQAVRAYTAHLRPECPLYLRLALYDCLLDTIRGDGTDAVRVQVASIYVQRLIDANADQDAAQHYLQQHDPRFTGYQSLFILLRDTDLPFDLVAPYLRYQSGGVYALMQLPPPTEHPGVVDAVIDAYPHQPYDNTRGAFIRKLIEWRVMIDPGKVLPHLRAWLASEPIHAVREVITRAISLYGDADDYQRLLAQMAREGPSTDLIIGLGRLGNATTVPILTPYLTNQNGRFQTETVTALSIIGTPAALEAVCGVMYEANILTVTGALSRIGGRGATEALLRLLYFNWEEPRNLQAVIPSIAKCGRPSDAIHLVPLLYADDRYNIGATLQAVGRLQNAALVPDIARFLGDNRKWRYDRAREQRITYSETAAVALEQIGTPEALQALEDYKRS
ncbi:MAG: HEAT repeat domain-containing protein [Chloroflexota bacterium]